MSQRSGEHRGHSWGEAGALVLIYGGTAAMISSLLIDVLVGRSIAEGLLGIVALALVALGGFVDQGIHRRARRWREGLQGEGIAVVAAAGAIQEGIRQALYYWAHIRISAVITAILVGSWAAVGVLWYLARWRRTVARDHFA